MKVKRREIYARFASPLGVRVFTNHKVAEWRANGRLCSRTVGGCAAARFYPSHSGETMTGNHSRWDSTGRLGMMVLVCVWQEGWSNLDAMQKGVCSEIRLKYVDQMESINALNG